MSNTFSVTILGCNAALPDSHRFSSAQWLQAGERGYLIDCAEGTQIQLRRFRLRFNALKAVFISHLHGDHLFGLPGLLSSFHLLGRTEPIDVYGPPPLKEWLETHLRFAMPFTFEIRVHAISKAAIIYADKTLEVSCFPLKHRVPTWGYLFRERPKLPHIRKDVISFYNIPLHRLPSIKAGADFCTDDGETIPNERLTIPSAAPRSYAYCSDTVYLPHLANVVHGLDLLYHEATYLDAEKSRAVENWHSTALQAAAVARDAEVGKLIIGHYSSRYDDVSPLVAEAQRVFTNTEAADDGKTFVVEPHPRPK